MAAVTRRQYKGAAASTTTTNSLTSVDTSVTLAAITGWPSTAAVPFYVVIDPGTSSEEKCSATISGSTLTLTRGQDDTTAVSHSSGATIYPVFSADDADEANALASVMTTRGDIIKMGTGPTVARLAIGSSGAVLYSDGTDPAWASLSTAGIAPVASPTFTGTPAAPTAANGTNTTQLATTAYVYANGSQVTVSTKTASYVLVAADRNTRVVMNSASATTLTVNTSLFSAGDSLEIANIGAGVCTITAGTCTVGTTGTLALAQNATGKLVFISASAAIYLAGDTGSTVRQVLSTTLTTAFTSGAAGAYANVTGLSVVITPATNTNKILIMASVNGGTFMAVKVTGGNTATGYSVNSYASADSAGNNDYVAQASMLYLDSPATTSAVTYQVQSKDLAGGTSYINRSQNSATAVAASTITCMEIVA